MSLVFIYLFAGFVAILLIILWQQNLALSRKVVRLKKEVEIQDSKLNYQKKRSSDSANYFFSAVLIIMEMMGQIDSALKNEEEDLTDRILQIIFEKAKDLLRPQRCILFKIDTKENSCARLYTFGYNDEELNNLNFSLDQNNSFLGWSVQTGRFFCSDEAGQDSLLSHLLADNQLKCHYSQPLKVDNKVKAVLCVGQLSQHIEKDVVVRLFSVLSNIASVALSNALLTQELRKLSVRDSLTGLYNHSYFQKWLDTPLSRLDTKHNVLSLVMVDLDDFKKINDVYGHQTGDVILKRISELLNNLQTNDYICARYGGEEFVLSFIDKDVNQVREIMEGVRKNISQEVFGGRGEPIRITISVGIVEARFSETKQKISKRELIGLADQALYKAKAEGRNRVIVTEF